MILKETPNYHMFVISYDNEQNNLFGFHFIYICDFKKCVQYGAFASFTRNLYPLKYLVYMRQTLKQNYEEALLTYSKNLLQIENDDQCKNRNVGV